MAKIFSCIHIFLLENPISKVEHKPGFYALITSCLLTTLFYGLITLFIVANIPTGLLRRIIRVIITKSLELE